MFVSDDEGDLFHGHIPGHVTEVGRADYRQIVSLDLQEDEIEERRDLRPSSSWAVKGIKRH